MPPAPKEIAAPCFFLRKRQGNKPGERPAAGLHSALTALLRGLCLGSQSSLARLAILAGQGMAALGEIRTAEFGHIVPKPD